MALADDIVSALSNPVMSHDDIVGVSGGGVVTHAGDYLSSSGIGLVAGNLIGDSVTEPVGDVVSDDIHATAMGVGALSMGLGL